MPVTIRFLGTAAFEIVTADGKRLLIDPFLDKNLVSPYKVADVDELDLLLVTHGTYDHLGDAEAILCKFPDLPLICGADVRGYLMYIGHRRGAALGVVLGHEGGGGQRTRPARGVSPLVLYLGRRRTKLVQYSSRIHHRSRGRRTHLPQRRHDHIR